MDWQAYLDELLHPGETVRETVDTGASRVVVTNRRLLAFTPAARDKRFHEVALPNVTGVVAAHRTPRRLLRPTLRLGTAGVACLTVGAVLDSLAFVAPVSVGADLDQEIGAVESAQLVLAFFGRLDLLFLQLGGVLFFAALALGGVYWYRRQPTIIVRTAGDGPDIHVPRPAGASMVVGDIERAIEAED